jgi:hypothetical protein
MDEKPRITSIRRSGGPRRTAATRQAGAARKAPTRVTLTAATRAGDRVAILRALMDRLAESIEVATPKDVAALARRMLDVGEELAKLEAIAEDPTAAAEATFDPNAI